MTKDKELFEKYDWMFKNRRDIQASGMYFGFQCKDGWYNLISNLLKFIDWHYNEESTSNTERCKIGHENFEVLQVKEKYGNLRFSVVGGDDFIDGAVEMVCSLSETTCEQCGAPSKIFNKGGWLFNKCEKCKETMNT